MAGTYSEFKHEALTEEEANFLVGSYKKRGIEANKTQVKTTKMWEVTALLEEVILGRSGSFSTPGVWGNANVKRVCGRGLGDKNTGGSRT